jgi:dTDP-4-amino-4,6-dideoxygalactose transaminase
MNFNALDFPEAELYYKEAISLPIYPSLSDAQQNEVIDKLLNLCS